MIAAKQTIYTLLSTDSQLQTLLGALPDDKKIYPVLADKFEMFPCITYKVVTGSFRINSPSRAEDMVFEFNIYTKSSQEAMENIFTRLNNLLNYYTNQFAPIVFCKLEYEADLTETDRSLFRKVLRYRVWTRN